MRVIQGSHVDWKCLDRTTHASRMDYSKMNDSVDTPKFKKATVDESSMQHSLLNA